MGECEFMERGLRAVSVKFGFRWFNGCGYFMVLMGEEIGKVRW